MASMSSAPACRQKPSTMRRRCAATSHSPSWNAPFAASRPSICTCGRSSPIGRSGPRACLPLHARLLPRMAHAPAPRADAVRRHRQSSGRGTAFQRGGDGAALTGGCRQADHPPDRRRAAGAQLPLPAGGSRNLGTQHHRHRDHTQLATHRAHKADPDTAQGIHPAQSRDVASRRTPPRCFPSTIQALARFTLRKFGLRNRYGPHAPRPADAGRCPRRWLDWPKAGLARP